jgi:sigma-E factor negative regulatory protein RseA
MTDRDEELAWLLDDFAGDNPSAELDAVIEDVNLQYRVRRYRMIGEAMRHELPDAIDPGFHASVMAKVRVEAAQTLPAQPPEDRAAAPGSASLFGWLSKPLAGMAVAATVAVVTVVLWTPVEPDPAAEGAIASAETQKVEKLAGQQLAVTPVTVSTKVQPGGMRWKVDNDAPALQQKLNAYLVNHTEYSNSVQGFIPQARVAGFDSQQ